jgi:acyl transferase domain-containing protein
MSEIETSTVHSDISPQDIAVIGISCRFPQSPDKEAFWKNLINNTECITHLKDEQIKADRHLIPNPSYVPVSGIIDEYDHFDASLFSIPDRTAELMTPSHRTFIESAWDVMIDAGYDASSYAGYVESTALATLRVLLHIALHPIGLQPAILFLKKVSLGFPMPSRPIPYTIWV